MKSFGFRLLIGILVLASRPTLSRAPVGIVAVDCGGNHSVALRADGTVLTWGSSEYSQLARSQEQLKSFSFQAEATRVPLPVRDLRDIKAVAAGLNHTLVLKADGTVWGWGANYWGQVGDGTKENPRELPAQVAGLHDVTALAAGFNHSLALKRNGTVAVWGFVGNSLDGEGLPHPSLVPGLADIKAISGKGGHAVALKSNGTVWVWGDNLHGQLGNGTTGGNSLSPIQVPGLIGVVAISAGSFHTLALKADGTVWGWGDNGVGQLGDGTFGQHPSPVQVSGLSGITAIFTGHAHSFAIARDGTVYGWGYNTYGELGDGAFVNRSSPVLLRGFAGAAFIAGGADHTIAIKKDGSVWVAGYNYAGQLGMDGPTRPSPTRLSSKEF